MEFTTDRGIIAAIAAVLFAIVVPASADMCDPQQVYKYVAIDGGASDQLGESIGVSGNIAIVGARLNDGVHIDLGSAYLFDIDSGQHLFKLTASDGGPNDGFGVSVAVSENIAIVGAYRHDHAGGVDAGAAYLFDVTTGQQLFKLTAADAATGDGFGESVAISGNIAIVGARNNHGGSSSSGAAYLFDATTGQQLFKLTALDAATGDQFGYSVAISGNIAIVGAYGNDDGGSNSGSAYLFDVTTGQQLFKLIASDDAAEDRFGISVAIEGNIAIVGAYLNDHGGNTNAGAAYLFDVTTGQQLFKLIASDRAMHDQFGRSVAIKGNIATIGAYLDDHSGVLDAGSAYLFDITTGQQLFKLIASDPAEFDNFGRSVALGQDAAVVGSPLSDGADVDSGAAYVFLLADCNGNGICDRDDIVAGTSFDCNANAVPDECDIASGQSQDDNLNGVPDECEAGLTVTIALPGVADGVMRCYELIFTDCSGVNPPLELTQEVTAFGEQAMISVSDVCDQYDCVSVRDPKHSLWRTAAIVDSGSSCMAEFTGSAALVQGNFNGDSFIDILDFGVLVAQFGTDAGGPETLCGQIGDHCDINADGIVDVLDFSFVSMSFLIFDDPNCCAFAGLAEGRMPQPVQQISVKELHRRGLGHLAVGDVNRDGWLDTADMAAFLSGR